MFSSFSNLVWGGSEEQSPPINNVIILYDDSTVTEDDWVLVKEIANEKYRLRDGSSSQEDERASSLQTLFEENKPESSGFIKEESSRGEISPKADEPSDSIDNQSAENLLAEKASDNSDKSSLEILFAEVQPTETEPKEDSDHSMKTDETDFSEKSSLQFLFDESLHKETSNAGNNSTSVFTLKPLIDPPVLLEPNAGQSRPLKKSYSADYHREQPETVETVLRRRHVTRASKRLGEGSTAFASDPVLQKRNKKPSEGTSGVGRGQETKARTRKANSVASGQSESDHGKRRKRTAEKFSGKGGRRNCWDENGKETELKIKKWGPSLIRQN